MEHMWMFFKYAISSPTYPQFCKESANARLCGCSYRSLVDLGGNRVATPILFKDTTFDGTDAEVSTPGNPHMIPAPALTGTPLSYHPTHTH